MDDLLKKYLQNKYGENFEQDAQNQYDERTSGLNTANLFSNIGDVIAGNKVGSANDYFSGLKKQAKDDTLGKIENDKKSYMANAEFNNKQADFDPSSSKSVAFRNTLKNQFPSLAAAYGDSFDSIAAGDMESIMNPLRLKETVEARKESARLMSQQHNDAKREKADEKLQALQTPFGTANTPDDAKQLKEAFESKKNFDGKIQELIDLRTKYGGEMMNREAVARGEQLSKDLLLEYKNMAKLGVLSKADEDIINAIIPADPLKFSWIPGQDPIMNNMKKFKEDSDKDFATRTATRTRAGTKELQSGNPLEQKPEKTIVKTQVNTKTGQTRVVYSDGSIEIQQKQAGK